MKIDPIPSITIESIPDGNETFGRHPRRRPTKRRVKLFSGITLSLLFLSWLLFGDFMSDTYAVVTFDGDPKAVELARGSGMNMNGMALFLSKSPQVINADTLHAHCPTEKSNVVEFGCYDPSKDKIYILKITKAPYAEASYTTAAHEMLHAAWDELNTRDQENVSKLLNNHIRQSDDKYSKSVKDSLKQYGKDDAIRATELHSFIGSEVNNDFTDDQLDAHYARYFSNRLESTGANDRFNKGLHGINSDIAVRKQKMKEKERDLTNYANEWLHPIEAYMQQSLYYGDAYSYNQNVEAYNNNLEIYNDKYASYKKFSNTLNSDIEKHNHTMSAMMPSKKLENVTPVKSE